MGPQPIMSAGSSYDRVSPCLHPLPLHTSAFSPLVCISHIARAARVCLEASGHRHTNAQQVMLHLSAGAVSDLGPCYLAQGQQRLHSPPQGPRLMSVFPSLHCPSALASSPFSPQPVCTFCINYTVGRNPLGCIQLCCFTFMLLLNGDESLDLVREGEEWGDRLFF